MISKITLIDRRTKAAKQSIDEFDSAVELQAKVQHTQHVNARGGSRRGSLVESDPDPDESYETD
jgi:hypothetical protein